MVVPDEKNPSEQQGEAPLFHSPADVSEFRYRIVSKSAVACIVFAILGLLSFLSPVFVLLPALGFGFGIIALINFRKYPDELVGLWAAKIGLLVSGVSLIASIAMHSYIHATEVPEGYTRISYDMLRDNLHTPTPYSEKAEELDGKKVFLKGYVRPGSKKTDLRDFILVGDFGSCCFGGNPKITDVVAVHIVDDNKTVDYGYRLRRVTGTFRLNPHTARTQESDVPQVFYTIEADDIK